MEGAAPVLFLWFKAILLNFCTQNPGRLWAALNKRSLKTMRPLINLTPDLTSREINISQKKEEQLTFCEFLLNNRNNLAGPTL